MSSEGSVTGWLQDVKAGEEQAAQRLWERYFGQLVRLCRTKLGGRPWPIADEEDVALSLSQRLPGAAARPVSRTAGSGQPVAVVGCDCSP